MEETRKWEEIEMDCLVCIFERVGLEDLILGVPLVCKSWYEVSTNPLCWKSLNFAQLNLHPNSHFVQRFKQQYRIEKFSFANFLKFAVDHSRQSALEIVLPSLEATYVSLEDLDYLSKQCPALKRLSLPFIMFPQAEKHIPHCLSKWNKLEHLSMHGKPISFMEVLTELSFHCKNFKKLEMRGSYQDQDALAIATMLPKIKHLCLSKSFMSKEGLLMILRGCRELETLDIKYCTGFKVDAEIQKMASHIKTFEFVGCSLKRRFPFGI
ncbi:F-box/LRR-repeat-like protein [Cinnamomum micranthum f. kanehirae]|uniref:F-box/LRR-repeat-like protein n=1 Tax=Cinnamomum micranthum f. kanehirae TaxID=337451 RepID=A0A3S3NJA3_9MAGN|nr:F-box/LRR-repeat-like protein [Cinnamomum micranthum f. kanehirae]